MASFAPHLLTKLGRHAGQALGDAFDAAVDLKDAVSSGIKNATGMHVEKRVAAYVLPDPENIISPKDLLENNEEREAILQTLPPSYYTDGFAPLPFEFGQLPLSVTDTEISATVDAREGVLEVSF